MGSSLLIQEFRNPRSSDEGEPASSVIKARRLCKNFVSRKRWRKETVEAVRDVSFTCRSGEIYGLLGANGAGKTTTLRMLGTILRPTSGTASVAGFDIGSDAHRVRQRVGFLSTQTALYGRLTAREFVQYFGRLHDVSEEDLDRRVEEIFERLDMNEFRDRRCDKLSTGQKQKTSIARTLIHDPPVMIFDEPTAGLDVLAQRTILAFVRECRDRKKTVIFSTHVMSEAEKLCDRLGIIHSGRLVAEGTIAELRQKYAMDDLEDLFLHLVSQNGKEAA
jgi:sodium transport system ATP-binding protein